MILSGYGWKPGAAAALAAVLVVFAIGGPAAASEEFLQRAQLRAANSVTLSVGMGGILSKVTVREGETVVAGAVVATLDCTAHRATRRVHEARVQAAKAKERVADRMLQLNQGSGLEVELARAEAAMTAAELAVIDAELRRCDIRAPFAGVVVDVPARAGEYLREGDPVVEIIDTARPEVEMVLPGRWLSWLKPGTPFVFVAEAVGRDIPATVDRVGGRIDPVSGTLRVIGQLDETQPDVLPGMSGGVRFAEPSASITAAP